MLKGGQRERSWRPLENPKGSFPQTVAAVLLFSRKLEFRENLSRKFFGGFGNFESAVFVNRYSVFGCFPLCLCFLSALFLVFLDALSGPKGLICANSCSGFAVFKKARFSRKLEAKLISSFWEI